MIQGPVEATEELSIWRRNLVQVSDMEKFHQSDHCQREKVTKHHPQKEVQGNESKKSRAVAEIFGFQTPGLFSLQISTNNVAGGRFNAAGTPPTALWTADKEPQQKIFEKQTGVFLHFREIQTGGAQRKRPTEYTRFSNKTFSGYGQTIGRQYCL